MNREHNHSSDVPSIVHHPPNRGDAKIIQGFEWLAERSSLFCLHMLSHLVVADQILEVLDNVRQRYTRIFPSETDFDGLPVSHISGVIHSVLYSSRTKHVWNTIPTEGPMNPFVLSVVRWRVQWDVYQLSANEHTIVARALIKFAQLKYKGSGWHEKVSRWLLRLAVCSLSQDPLPSPSIIYDSLSIIAIDLGCDVPRAIVVKPSDQRQAHIKQVTVILIRASVHKWNEFWNL